MSLVSFEEISVKLIPDLSPRASPYEIMHNAEGKYLNNSTLIMASKNVYGSKMLCGDKCWLGMVDLLIPLRMF